MARVVRVVGVVRVASVVRLFYIKSYLVSNALARQHAADAVIHPNSISIRNIATLGK